jgi:CRISPR-associated helicase Cas3
MIVREQKFPLISHSETRLQLYPHQAVILDQWEKQKAFLLETKTGTGKTIGAVLPLLKRKQRAILVYPTNELIRDQVASIGRIAEMEGLKACVLTPETSKEAFARADVVLVHIDAATLAEWDKKRHLGGKWAVLKYLLQADKPVKLILTNPDVLFLIFALRYRAEPLAALQAYQNLIIDEFHLYQGVEFAHALFMIHLARSMGMFERVVLLSATPPPEVRDFLGRVIEPFVVDQNVSSSCLAIGEHTATHEVEIHPLLAGPDVVETGVGLLMDLKETFSRLRREHSGEDYIPGVVVLNSVVNAIRLEDRLAEEGLDRNELLIIRGLSSREIRRRDASKTLAIGTAAIEVGIDFRCDYLVFEASEAAAFMQRFGRVGRHQPGTAYVLCPQNVKAGIEKLPPRVDRGEFEKYIYDWYPSLAARPWFAATRGGLITICALARSIVDRVAEDPAADPKVVAGVKKTLEDIVRSYARVLDMEKVCDGVLGQFEKAQKGIQRYQWMKVYEDLNTFRTSLPSEMVCDFAERHRRGIEWDKAKYSVDMATLLKRAQGLRFNEKIPHPEGGLGMLTVKGYGRYKKVWVMPTFEDEDCGVFRVTADHLDLCFVQEGHKTSVSHLMTFRPHIFVVVPKAVEMDVDWRMPVFECGRHLIAFDGAALLLNELWERNLTVEKEGE